MTSTTRANQVGRKEKPKRGSRLLLNPGSASVVPPDPRACTEQSYRTRIVELQIKSGQLVAPKAVSFACTGGKDDPFLATFYNETDPPSAAFTYGNDQVIAVVAPSGSGARYTAANVEFWEHQGEATVKWFGTELKCRPKSSGP